MGVAAAGVGAGVGSAVGGAIDDKTFVGQKVSAGSFGHTLASSAAGGIANAARRSAIEGTSFERGLIEAIPDIIGNTIGNLVAEGITSLGKSDDIIVTSNGGRKGDVISDGTISDPALQGLVDKAKGYNLRGLENDYEDARSDAGEIRAKLAAAKSDGESAKRIASLEQKLAQREARVLSTAKAFEPALLGSGLIAAARR